MSLEEALNYIKEEQFAAAQEVERLAAAEASKRAAKRTIPHSASNSSLQKRRRGNDTEAGDSGTTAEDALGTEVDDERAMEEGVSPRRSVSSGSVAQQDGSSAGDAASQSEGTSTVGYDELWCTHCMDDKGVSICAFCGCKVST